MKLPPNTEVRSYGAEALVRLTPEIRALLTKKDKFGGEYVLYRQDNPTQDYAYVPRSLVNKNDADIVDVSYRPCPPIKPSAPPQTDDQAQVIADCLDLLRKGVDHVVEAPTGFGKSYVGSVVAGALGQKTLIVVTKNDLVLSWQETLTQFMGQKHNQIGHVQQNVLRYKDCRYTVAMIHTLVGREYDPEFYSAFGLIIFDECFPAGTMVGDKPIEGYVVGDTVGTVLPDGTIGTSVVTATTNKQGDWFARASYGGYTLVSTTTQPIFVEGLGFIPAALLLKGDYVLRQMPKSRTRPVQENQGEVQEGDASLLLQITRGVVSFGERGESQRPTISGVEQATRLKKDDREQPDGAINCASESVSGPKRQALPCTEGWQREAPDSTAEAIVGRFERFITSSGVPDWSTECLRAWPTSELLNGYCNSESEAVHRTRWAFTQYFEGAGIRLEKGLVLEKSRVAGVEIQKRERAIELGWGIGTGEVYNLEVAHTHNYFANGVLVHNCHRLGAEYFSQACSKFNAAHRLALSATPDRSDGKEIVFHAHIGPIMVKGTWVPMKPKVLVLKTGCKLPNAHSRDEATGKWVYGPMKVVPGRMANVNKALAENHSRNMEIVRFVKQAFDAGRTIVLMSDLLEGHLTPLFHLITAAGISGEDIGYYHGQIKKQDLNHNKKRRIVLATYQMCSEGTNVVEWDTLVMVTPRSKVKQPIGRVMRFKQGKKTPVILELVDDNDVLKTFHFSRLKQYYEVHAEIINL